MSARRTARVASMIREVVSSAILSELRDPRIRNVTVLGAEVSPDLRYSRVRVSIMGDEKTAALTMHGLNSATGYLRSRVGEYIKSRHIPEIRFVLDEGIQKSVGVSAILREVLPEGSAEAPLDVGSSAASNDDNQGEDETESV